MVRRWIGLALAALVMAGCASTRPNMPALAPTVAPQNAVVKITLPAGGEDFVTRAEFEQARDKLGLGQRASEQQILDFLATRHLLLHEARLKDVTADPQEVDQVYNQVTTQNCAQAPIPEAQTEKDPAKLVEACARFFGFENAAALRRYLQEDLTIQQLTESNVPATATAGPATLPENVQETHSAHILVQTEDEARKVRERVTTGKEDFAKVAQEVSIDPSAKQNGGDLGFVLPGQFVPEFEQAAAALQPGEISEPVQSQFGYHIIKLIERRPLSAEARAQAEQQAQQQQQQADQQQQAMAAEQYRQTVLEKAKQENRVQYLITPAPPPTQAPPPMELPTVEIEPDATAPAQGEEPERTPTADETSTATP